MNTGIKSKTKKVCGWWQDGDGMWESTCKYAFDFVTGATPRESEFNFCPKCGGKLETDEIPTKDNT